MPDRVSMLADVAEVVTRSHDLEETLANVTDLVSKRLDADDCSIFMVEPEQNELRLAATMGLDSAAVGSLRIPVGEGMVGMAAERGESVAVENLAAFPAHGHSPGFGEERFASMLATPMLVQGVVIGVLSIRTVDSRRFEEADIDLLQTCASLLAPVVVNAQLLALMTESSEDRSRTVESIEAAPSAPRDDRAWPAPEDSTGSDGQPWIPFPPEMVDELQALTLERENEKTTPVRERECQQAIDKLFEGLKRTPTAQPGFYIAGVQLNTPIGKGNFGTIWRGLDESGHTRAVKIFDSDRLGLGTQLYHFRRGVRAIQELNDQPDRPDLIIRLLHVDPSHLAFSMDYAEGGALRSTIVTDWSLEKRLDFFEKVCQAVSYAHSKRIIHRDIKPENILVAASGDPVLTDFDIADLLFAQTRSAHSAGSVLYSAPEQFDDSETRTPSVDVFSLGKILHFLLIAANPPLGFEEEPALTDLDATYPQLARVVRRATMRDPARRFKTVDGLLEGFHHARQPESDQDVAAVEALGPREGDPSQWRLGWPAIAAIATAVAALVAAASFILSLSSLEDRIEPSDSPRDATVPNEAEQPVPVVEPEEIPPVPSENDG